MFLQNNDFYIFDISFYFFLDLSPRFRDGNIVTPPSIRASRYLPKPLRCIKPKLLHDFPTC